MYKILIYVAVVYAIYSMRVCVCVCMFCHLVTCFWCADVCMRVCVCVYNGLNGTTFRWPVRIR